jgi:hypothetical protein
MNPTTRGVLVVGCVAAAILAVRARKRACASARPLAALTPDDAQGDCDGDARELAEQARRQGRLTTLSLSGRKAVRIPSFVFTEFDIAASLQTLDLSKNQLRELPSAIGELAALTELSVSRNFLKRLPAELGRLARLVTLDVSSNVLRATHLSLESLAALRDLRTLDLRYNNKIDATHSSTLAARLPGATCLVTARALFDDKSHAADRDATLVRSQLQPFSTGTLRRRLALVFGDTTDPDTVERDELMRRLLACYDAHGPRAVRRVRGAPVSPSVCAELLEELEAWAEQEVRERPTIQAQQYMILSAPGAFSTKHAGKAKLAARKVAAHGKLWALARRAMEEVDPQYAKLYTAVAFTKNFVGSPHIDTQNTGPFYGLALGDFSEGGGALCVECSAREVAYVDTRRRLGRVDGRFPHWVAPYESGTRFSVIYYQTQGQVVPVTTAVFEGEATVDDPATFCAAEDRYYNRYCQATNTYAPSA